MIKPLKTTCLAAAFATALIAPARAAAPMAGHPAPGYYRMMVGDFEVTPISDGTMDLPVDRRLNEEPEIIKAALAKSYLTLPVETSDNAFLINTGGKLVLVDTGAGVLYGPTLGKFIGNLKAAGYQPEQIDEIYITHFHNDHVGGLVSEGKISFPNAVVRADQRDAEFWLSKENMDRAPQDKKVFFQGAQTALAPYLKAGRFKPFDGDTELAPGIAARAARGHTPGHTIYMIESRGQRLMLIGDLIHVAALQMENPQVTYVHDSDAQAARAARLKEFDAAARDGCLVGGAHLQFPGLGHLRSEGKGYRWVPVNYTQMR